MTCFDNLRSKKKCTVYSTKALKLSRSGLRWLKQVTWPSRPPVLSQRRARNLLKGNVVYHSFCYLLKMWHLWMQLGQTGTSASERQSLISYLTRLSTFWASARGHLCAGIWSLCQRKKAAIRGSKVSFVSKCAVWPGWIKVAMKHFTHSQPLG